MSENGLYWGSDLTTITDSEEVFVTNLLWQGQTVILFAPEKAGKSVLALQLACCLSSGSNLFEHMEVKVPRSVLYMQFEGTRPGTQKRIISMEQAGVGLDRERFLHLFAPGIALDDEKGFKWVVSTLDDHQLHPEVFIIDPLYMCVSGGLSCEMAARRFANTTRNLIDKYKACVLIVHHSHRPKSDEFGRKVEEGDDSIYGSFVWKAFADHTLMLRKDEKTYQRVLSCRTQRDGEVPEEVKFYIQRVPLRCMEKVIPLLDRAK